MIDNTHNLNRQIAVTMAICTTFLICLLLLDFFAVFNFSEELMFAISVIGIPTLISPLILCFFKVPDKFLKYYIIYNSRKCIIHSWNFIKQCSFIRTYKFFYNFNKCNICWTTQNHYNCVIFNPRKFTINNH